MINLTLLVIFIFVIISYVSLKKFSLIVFNKLVRFNVKISSCGICYIGGIRHKTSNHDLKIGKISLLTNLLHSEAISLITIYVEGFYFEKHIKTYGENKDKVERNFCLSSNLQYLLYFVSKFTTLALSKPETKFKVFNKSSNEIPKRILLFHQDYVTFKFSPWDTKLRLDTSVRNSRISITQNDAAKAFVLAQFGLESVVVMMKDTLERSSVNSTFSIKDLQVDYDINYESINDLVTEHLNELNDYQQKIENYSYEIVNWSVNFHFFKSVHSKYAVTMNFLQDENRLSMGFSESQMNFENVKHQSFRSNIFKTDPKSRGLSLREDETIFSKYPSFVKVDIIDFSIEFYKGIQMLHSLSIDSMKMNYRLDDVSISFETNVISPQLYVEFRKRPISIAKSHLEDAYRIVMSSIQTVRLIFSKKSTKSKRLISTRKAIRNYFIANGSPVSYLCRHFFFRLSIDSEEDHRTIVANVGSEESFRISTNITHFNLIVMVDLSQSIRELLTQTNKKSALYQVLNQTTINLDFKDFFISLLVDESIKRFSQREYHNWNDIFDVGYLKLIMNPSNVSCQISSVDIEYSAPIIYKLSKVLKDNEYIMQKESPEKESSQREKIVFEDQEGLNPEYLLYNLLARQRTSLTLNSLNIIVLSKTDVYLMYRLDAAVFTTKNIIDSSDSLFSNKSTGLTADFNLDESFSEVVLNQIEELVYCGNISESQVLHSMRIMPESFENESLVDEKPNVFFFADEQFCFYEAKDEASFAQSVPYPSNHPKPLKKDKCKDLTSQVIKFPSQSFNALHRAKKIEITCRSEVAMIWKISIVLIVMEAIRVARHFLSTCRKAKTKPSVWSWKETSLWTIKWNVKAAMKIFFELATPEHNITLIMNNFCIWSSLNGSLIEVDAERDDKNTLNNDKRLKDTLEKFKTLNNYQNFYRTLFDSENIQVFFDHHLIIGMTGFSHRVNIFQCQNRSMKVLNLPDDTNHSNQFSIDNLSINFPYGYRFYDCYYEMSSIKKFLHRLSNNMVEEYEQVIEVPVEEKKNDEIFSDRFIHIKDFTLNIKDDPFECKLSDDFMVLLDEYNEHEKRIEVLRQKLEEYANEGQVIGDADRENLVKNLETFRDKEYTSRLARYYEEYEVSDDLFTWRMINFSLISIFDPNLRTKTETFEKIKKIDPISVWPSTIDPENEFEQLWLCRIDLRAQEYFWKLRDYTHPLWLMKDLEINGLFGSSEEKSTWKSQREIIIKPGFPWPEFTLVRQKVPHKWYYDILMKNSEFSYSYGPNWEPTFSWFNCRMEDILPVSSDPSRPVLGWWDRFRLILHGKLNIESNKFTLLYPITLDPYNSSEFFVLDWSNLKLSWISGEWIFDGNLDIQARNSSQIESGSRLLHLPNLRFVIQIEWLTFGNPNLHHNVVTVNPDRVDPESKHDSFKDFRAHRVVFQVSFKINQSDSKDHPKCFFHTSILKFFDKIKVCMNRISRPIRRGYVFNRKKPRKPQFNRLIQHFSLNIAVPELELIYWVSNSKRIGVHLRTAPIRITANFQLFVSGDEKVERKYYREMVSNSYLTRPITQYVMVHKQLPFINSDGLFRRPAHKWGLEKACVQIQGIHAWLLRREKVSIIPFLLKVVKQNSENSEKIINHGCDEDFHEISHPDDSEFIIIPFLQISKNTPEDKFMSQVNDKNPTKNKPKTPAYVSLPDMPHTEEEKKKKKNSISHEDLIPENRVEVRELKMRWSQRNRDLIHEMMSILKNARDLKRNLSAQALKVIQLNLDRYNNQQQQQQQHIFDARKQTTNLQNTTPGPQQGDNLENIGSIHDNADQSTFMSANEEGANRGGNFNSPFLPDLPMLYQLIDEKDTAKFYAYCEDDSKQPNVVDQLQGLQICKLSEILDRKWAIELLNSQILMEVKDDSKDYLIVSAAKAKVDYLINVPVWKDTKLLGKNSIVCQLECMQYYATLRMNKPTKVDDEAQCTVKKERWLPLSEICISTSQANEDTLTGHPDVVGCSKTLGGVVNLPTDTDQDDMIQLQRMISRCSSQIYYVSYEPIDHNDLQELDYIPPLPLNESELLINQEGANVITLLHRTLNGCTNSAQYHMVVDLINELILYVEPQKRLRQEKNRLRLSLMSETQIKAAILMEQEYLRSMSTIQRKFEQELFNTIVNYREMSSHKNSISDSFNMNQSDGNMENLLTKAFKIEKKNKVLKKNMAERNTLLTQTLLYYKQIKLRNQRLNTMKTIQMSQMTRSTVSLDGQALLTGLNIDSPRKTDNDKMGEDKKQDYCAEVIRRSEICFEHAQWKMTDDDGQIGLTDVEIRGFLYTRTHREDDSGSHGMELSWIRVSSLLPNSIYKEVLVPDLSNSCSTGCPVVRIGWAQKAPVGGLVVNEAMEISIAPLILQMSKQFYSKMMPFFFPSKEEYTSLQTPHQTSSKAPTGSVHSNLSRYQRNLDTRSNQNVFLSPIDEEMSSNSTNNKSEEADLASENSKNWLTKHSLFQRKKKRQGNLNKSSPNLKKSSFSSSPNVSPALARRKKNLRHVASDAAAHGYIHNQLKNEDSLQLPANWFNDDHEEEENLFPNEGETLVDMMSERARRNNVFLYIKIPGFPILLSYKGNKQKNVVDVTSFQLNIPTLEYHNTLWTWLDFAMEVKTRIRKQLIKELIKKTFSLRRRLPLMGKVDKPSGRYQKNMDIDDILGKMENKEDPEEDNEVDIPQEEIVDLASVDNKEDFEINQDDGQYQNTMHIVIGRHSRDSQNSSRKTWRKFKKNQ